MFESLSRNNIKPASKLSLPERIIQFGNGVLLRGLLDFYIQKANEKGIFNGKIVIFHSQDTNISEEHCAIFLDLMSKEVNCLRIYRGSER